MAGVIRSNIVSKQKPDSNAENNDNKKRKNKKAQRNEEKKRSNASLEAERVLSKMRYYWIFTAIWALLGVMLLCIGLYSGDAKIQQATAVKAGCCIIAFGIGAAIYGARKQYFLQKKAQRSK